MTSNLDQEDKTTQENETDSYQSHLVPAELPYDFQRATASQEALQDGRLSSATKLGLTLISGAILLGGLGNYLFQRQSLGLNVGLWLATLLVMVLAIDRVAERRLKSKIKWILMPTMFFGLTFAWRDSITLNGLSIVALILVASLFTLQIKSGQLIVKGVSDHLINLFTLIVSVLIGPAFLIFQDTKWREVNRDGWSKNALAIGRGVAIAAPLLLIFGGLLISADANFQNLIAQTFRFNVETVVNHIIITGLLAWFSAGLMRLLFLPTDQTVQVEKGRLSISLGIVETATVIGLLDALFLAFVLVQFHYFFGGRSNIPTGRGVEYAEYARHGFFELVWVSVLVLPLLLGAHWLLRKENASQEKLFRVLSVVMLALLSVIMVSAMQRMRLYQRECGLTELRIYTMAFMVWLGSVFVWFAATVLRGQRERFAFGAIMTGLATIVALHFVNPDYLIAKVNLERAREGKSFDAAYTASLSADAVPVLQREVHTLKMEDQKIIHEQLKLRWEAGRNLDWRSWNWARAAVYQYQAAK